jgi:hypothetical protein
MKPSSGDETYTYRIHATAKGADIEVSESFWDDGGDARRVAHRIALVTADLEASLHAVAALGAPRH